MQSNSQFYLGIVENRQDPLKLGRCQVRIMGLHIHDKSVLPTEDLPWAYPMQPATSAAMNGIGYAPVGPVEGTTVILMFPDYPDNQQPVILGTLGGIPQSDSVNIGTINDEAVLKDGSGATVSVPTSDANLEQSTAPTPATPVDTSATPIPRIPPPTFRGDAIRAAAGINAIISACDTLGLTSKEAKCAILACAGGESSWIPQDEGYNYSATALQSTFKKTFAGKPDLANQYARAPTKGMSRETFFNFVYAPENNGSALGNNQAGDGGKYYGRGFIQLTGRTNYTRYGSLAGVDIINNPGLLNSDLNISAKVSVAYIKDRVKSVPMTANPEYFFAVKKAIGNDTGNGAQVRQDYYTYFYGAAAGSPDDAAKSAGAVPPDQTATGGGSSTGNANTNLGFKDPNNKYPLQKFIGEPDTNRLARGTTKGTIVESKSSLRDLGVPIALRQGTFDQPTIPYGGQYPFNHIYESESGHIQEFDDTPGYERIQTYHRSGTFTEIDVNGSEVHKIVGDSYTIVDRNGCIHIIGECNVTVGGNVNIFCQSDANIQVSGDATMEVGGRFDLGVAQDMTVAVGGKFSLWAGGQMSLQSAADTHIKTAGSMHVSSGGDASYTGNTVNIDGSQTYINSGTSAAAIDNALTPPAAGTPLNNTFDYLHPPSSRGEENFSYESEDEWQSSSGKAAMASQDKQYGTQSTSDTPAEDSSKATGGTTTTNIASCAVIFSTNSFPNSFKLSPNISLGMMFGSSTRQVYAQNGLSIQQIVCNLSQLCNNIIEPYLSVLPGGIGGYGKRWQITSGFRSAAIGSSTSDHAYGRACDIQILGGGPQDHYDLVRAMEKIVPYDQIILEYRTPKSVWIHTGFRGLAVGDTAGPGSGNRKMAFTMLNDKTYGQGFHLLSL